MKYIRSYQFILGSLVLLSTSLIFQKAAGIPPLAPTNKSKHINFIENAWGTTLGKAQKEHKYIFVDAYATWCGPCKQLKATTFKDEKAANFFNQNFVNLSIDMEKGDGRKLAKIWHVEAYPTLMILDSKGKVVLSFSGYLHADDLIRFGEQALQKNKQPKKNS